MVNTEARLYMSKRLYTCPSFQVPFGKKDEGESLHYGAEEFLENNIYFVLTKFCLFWRNCKRTQKADSWA